MDHVCRKAGVEEMDQPPPYYGNIRKMETAKDEGRARARVRVRGKGELVEQR
jgi:hypothetical protein